MMRALAAAGADLGGTMKDGTTVLMSAIVPTRGVGTFRAGDRRERYQGPADVAAKGEGEDEEITLRAVAAALDLGADVNAVDNNGETAMHAAAYKNLPKVVKFLAAKGAKIDVWNREDKFGWTPLAIAVGYRFGNFKPSPDTEAAIREVMIAAGVTPPKTVVARTQQIY